MNLDLILLLSRDKLQNLAIHFFSLLVRKIKSVIRDSSDLYRSACALAVST